MAFYQKWAHLFKYRFTPLNTPKSKNKFYFRKVHVLSYKKPIHHFFISPIVQEIFAKEENLKGRYSPLSGDFIFAFLKYASVGIPKETHFGMAISKFKLGEMVLQLISWILIFKCKAAKKIPSYT